jgi:hypothetical protein
VLVELVLHFRLRKGKLLTKKVEGRNVRARILFLIPDEVTLNALPVEVSWQLPRSHWLESITGMKLEVLPLTVFGMCSFGCVRT